MSRRARNRWRAFRESRWITVVAHEVRFSGGQEQVTAQHVQHLVDLGYRVVLVTGQTEFASSDRLKIVRVPGPRRPASIRFLTFLLAGSWLVFRHARGPIHTAGAIVVPPIDLASVHFCHAYFRREVGVRRASRETAVYIVNERVFDWLALRAERICYGARGARMLAPVSAGVARELARYYPRGDAAMAVVPNSVDVARFHPDASARREVRMELGLRGDDHVGLFVGGDWSRKGLALLIEALRFSPDWRCIVVGDGDVERHERIAQQHGVAERVHFAGRRSDVERFYAASDVFVLPSSYETFSLVAYEAAASELPVLATRVNGVEELIEKGGAGRFVEREPAAIAAELDVLRDRELRGRLGSAARQWVRSWTWEDATRSHLASYNRLARASGMATADPFSNARRRPPTAGSDVRPP
jgi:glycosyltransferase involved in cell wall biosynthesis